MFDIYQYQMTAQLLYKDSKNTSKTSSYCLEIWTIPGTAMVSFQRQSTETSEYQEIGTETSMQVFSFPLAGNDITTAGLNAALKLHTENPGTPGIEKDKRLP
jgi:hypothetical protein